MNIAPCLRDRTGMILLALASLFLIAFVFVPGQNADAAELPTYSELQLKNHDDMQALIRPYLRRAEDADSNDESLVPLERALVLLLSRPNYDNVLGALIDSVKAPLNDAGAYSKITNEIATRAISELKDDSVSPAVRATAMFQVTNLLSDLKSEMFGKNGDDCKKLIGRIQNQKLSVPKEVSKWLRNKSMMSMPRSPSEIAKDILADYTKQKKIRDDAEKAALAAEAQARAEAETQQTENEMNGENAPDVPKSSDSLDSQSETEIDLHLNSPKSQRSRKK